MCLSQSVKYSSRPGIRSSSVQECQNRVCLKKKASNEQTKNPTKNTKKTYIFVTSINKMKQLGPLSLKIKNNFEKSWPVLRLRFPGKYKL